MQQIQQKRQHFVREIRRKQHNQIFKKIRVQTIKKQKIVENHHSTVQQLLNQLPQMYELSSNIQKIVQNNDQILQFIKKIRQLENNIYALQQYLSNYSIPKQSIPLKLCQQDSAPLAMMPLIQFCLSVVTIIHSSMLAQQQSINEELHQSKQIPFAQLLLPISYMLINMLAEELPRSYFPLVLGFLKFRIFIDSFYNLFLTHGIDASLKVQFVQLFLGHLANYPRLFLNNYRLFTQILYYGIEQSPPLYGQKYYHIHEKAITQIDRIFSIISFSQNLQFFEKRTFIKFAFLILAKVCSKHIKNCWLIINSTNIMKNIQSTLFQLRTLFQLQKKFEQQFSFDYIQEALNLLQALGYYDQIISTLNQYYPTIWLHLLTLLQKYLISNYPAPSSKSESYLPALFETPHLKKIVLNSLKCVSNFVCLPQLCYSFIKYQFGKQVPNRDNRSSIQWISLLTEMYNLYYKYGDIRVECLTIFANILAIVQKQTDQFPPQAEPPLQQPSLPQILNQSTDLILQILKLTNKNKNIIILILNILLLLAQKMGDHAMKCQLFNDKSFRNRVHNIATANQNLGQGQGYGRVQSYSEDVTAHAHALAQLLLINMQ